MSNETRECTGLLLPIIDESTWTLGARAVIYLLGLLWSFMGVSIIADIFMCAIEVITSKKKMVKIANPKAEGGVEEIEVMVWNGTVANLTLMALGSSAPEILMSVIEIVGNKFYAGALGPSTIVGSAAFNLLIITAVCIVCIPKGEVRYIKLVKVFATTTFFSIFAYIWLYLVLEVSSPNEVLLWEAIFTFCCFPILVILAFVADKDFCRKKKRDHESDEEINLGVAGTDTYLTTDHVTKDGVAAIVKDVGKHPDLDPDTMATLAALEADKNTPHSRAWYRVDATRNMTGGKKLKPKLDPKVQQALNEMKEGHSVTSLGGSEVPIVQFAASASAVYENEKRVRIWINRSGNLNPQVIFKYETVDGTAEAGSDYIAQRGTMVFDANETQKYLDIEIIDDNEWEEDEVFFIKLALEPKSGAKLGKKNTMQITIINDDEPGTFDFSLASYLVKESVGDSHIPVIRSKGSDGRVEVKWKTTDMTATSGKDYHGGEGTLVFEHGEREKTIDIPIVDDSEFEKDESFKLELEEVSSGGAKLGKLKSTIITIVNDDEFNTILDRVINMTNVNLDRIRIGNATWGEQFRSAMNVNGGDVENAGILDYILHFFTFGWKIIFAFCPPPNFLNSGGWICFVVAICMIGLLTAIISDLASIFGCLVDLRDPVTAITFVALGTSLPDLFASKTAALNEKYADASIGNVTGSNSVNVFLGLGMSWLIATIYWSAKGEVFEVDSGTLSFSVLIYTICAVCCVLLLVARRLLPFFGKAELGGPRIPAILSAVFLVSLWVMYVLLCSFQVYKYFTF
ncbi:sodium/calcium exchanger 3-like isoform X2 [Glandiceps talaboti]